MQLAEISYTDGKPSILVVDDHPLFSHGMQELLRSSGLAGHVQIAAGGSEAIQLIRSRHFDYLLLDLRMPGKDGLATLAELAGLEQAQKPAPVIMSSFNDIYYLKSALLWGVKGYILKNTSLRELRRAFQQLLAGRSYFSPEITPLLAGPFCELNLEKAGKPLSIQEKKILRYICMQFDNQEIARELSLSVFTVKRHKQNIKEKTGALNTAGLVTYALRNNLLGLNDL